MIDSSFADCVDDRGQLLVRSRVLGSFVCDTEAEYVAASEAARVMLSVFVKSLSTRISTDSTFHKIKCSCFMLEDKEACI